MKDCKLLQIKWTREEKGTENGTTQLTIDFIQLFLFSLFFTTNDRPLGFSPLRLSQTKSAITCKLRRLGRNQQSPSFRILQAHPTLRVLQKRVARRNQTVHMAESGRSVSHAEGLLSANMDGSAASVSHAEGPPSANMPESAASGSHAGGHPSANMAGSAAIVSHVEGPPSANMDVNAASLSQFLTSNTSSIWLEHHAALEF